MKNLDSLPHAYLKETLFKPADVFDEKYQQEQEMQWAENRKKILEAATS